MKPTDISSTFSFQLGPAKITVINDGFAPFRPDVFFFNAPNDELLSALSRYGVTSESVFPFYGLAIQRNGRTILIDPGYGPLTPFTGHFPDNLATAGIDPAGVDTVIFTHGHADHCGGALNTQLEPAYVNAEYVLPGEEYSFWMSEGAVAQAGDRGRAAQKVFNALRGRIRLLQPGEEALPGFRHIDSGGHTPHNAILEVRLGGAVLLCVADALAHPIHLEHPEWGLEPDLDKPRALSARRTMLDRALCDGCLVHAYHMPLPAVGRIRSGENGGYRWEPLTVANP